MGMTRTTGTFGFHESSMIAYRYDRSNPRLEDAKRDRRGLHGNGQPWEGAEPAENSMAQQSGFSRDCPPTKKQSRD